MMQNRPFNTTYAPGPGQLSDAVRRDIKKAADIGIAEISHRGAEFTAISKKAVEGIRDFFKLPEGYHVFFTSSATDVWTIATHNLIENAGFHFINGNFSAGFARTVEAFGKTAHRDEAEWGTQNNFAEASIPSEADLISVCFNETSTGVMASNEDLRALRARYPDKTIAVDVTSIAGVYDLDIAQGDLWYFSVQKAMGLPAGLGVIIASPAALAKATRLSKTQHTGYFSLPAMAAKMEGKYQTIQTPNILNIYLLAEQLARWQKQGGVERIEKQTRARANALYDLFSSHANAHPSARPFVQNPKRRSISSICIQADEATIANWREKAQAQGLVLGTGYGKLKPTCIRLATFPGITDGEFEQLVRFFD